MSGTGRKDQGRNRSERKTTWGALSMAGGGSFSKGGIGQSLYNDSSKVHAATIVNVTTTLISLDPQRIFSAILLTDPGQVGQRVRCRGSEGL